MNYRDICDLREDFNNLSVANIETLRTINNKLKILEKQIKKESLSIDQHLMEKVEDDDDLLIDYEIRCEITFWIKNKRGMRSFDNSLSDWTENLKGISVNNGKLDDGVNYNQFKNIKHPLSDEHHCWLFYCLYSQTTLSWDYIVKISAAWSNLEITYQHCMEID